MMRAAAIAFALLLPAVAQADEKEASLALEGGIGFMNVEDIHDSGATTTRPGSAGMLRVGYGLSDLIEVDVGVGGALVYASEFRHQKGTPLGDGNTLHDTQAFRAVAGGTLRLGARLIPIFGLALGYQHRWLDGGALFDDKDVIQDLFADRSLNELLAIGSVGLEVRLNRHWLVGLAAQATAALGSGNGFVALEIPLRITYVWYPDWFRSSRIIRFEE